MPSSMCRCVFSSTTIASSTTKPVATVSAISDRLLMLKPARYMTEKVPISDTGTATAGMTAARTLRRKNSINNLSLMALTVATGFVVDDAIVVLENTQRHIEEGMPPYQAALRG